MLITSTTVTLPLGKLSKGDGVTISLNTLEGHTTVALPKEIEQTEPQFFVWNANSTYVDSWYPSDVERIKIRLVSASQETPYTNCSSPTPNILSHGNVPSDYTRDNTVTKAGATLTLGPFHSVPATLGDKSVQQPFHVHFEQREPASTLRSLKRSAEVSHWGANLNIQDDLELVNSGPRWVQAVIVPRVSY